jgi:hypothetical protein
MSGLRRCIVTSALLLPAFALALAQPVGGPEEADPLRPAAGDSISAPSPQTGGGVEMPVPGFEDHDSPVLGAETPPAAPSVDMAEPLPVPEGVGPEAAAEDGAFPSASPEVADPELEAPEGWQPTTLPEFAGDDLPSSSVFGLRLPGDYFAIRERPLFAPDRSPPRLAPQGMEEDEAELPAEVEWEPPEELPLVEDAPDWVLVGLIRSQGLNSAMFRKPGETASFSLRKGEALDGWLLAEIGRFEVYVENESGRARLAFPEAN